MDSQVRKWYRITKEIEVIVHDKPEISLANETKYWIKQMFAGRRHTTSRDNTYELFEYEIYNAFLEPSIISEMNLKCEGIVDIYENFFEIKMGFTIRDYYGGYKRLDLLPDGWVSREAIIKNFIIYMKEFGYFKTLEAIELAQENKKLQDSITELEKRIGRMNPEV